MPTQTIGSQHARELQEIADSICRSGQVLMVTGAGISTNSGIPDFRSANGLYNLVKKRYPDQTALLKGKDLFDAISFTNPITTAILYSFLAELRQTVKTIKDSTPTHKFIKTLSETGRLLRCYTQNIDGLEALDGLCMDISRGAGKRGKGKERVGRETGCEVVQLHGDLEMLRCTQCAKLHDYDEEKVQTLLEGEAPECPDCTRKADDREAAGKRSINVGTLRPNIVLYDEMHPQGDAIGQLTHYDATRMTPDLLLIFGTSLKVIGLKRIVKAFAGKVKSRGGKVVYINATPASDSVWGDIIDFHIKMDCDAWIKDLKLRRKEIWLHQSLLDKEWRKTKLSSIPSLKKSKTTTGYESDKENSQTLKGQPLVRRKSLSALPAKKKASVKEKQLPTPTNTPKKLKPKSMPNTPATSTSKRSHNAAFPPPTSPLTALGTSPSSSFLNTPNKRVRLGSTPLPPMNATTPPHYHRIQDLQTPQRPSPGAYSWLPSSRASSIRSSLATPTQRRYLSLSSPQRPTPDSPTLTVEEPSTPSRGAGRRYVLDHITVPTLEELNASSPVQSTEPVTPRRPNRSELSSLTNSLSTSARRSARRHGVSADKIFVGRTPSVSPSVTPMRGLARRRKLLDDSDTIIVKRENSEQLPTPPESQIPSEDRDEEEEEQDLDEYEETKYHPRNNIKRRVFIDDRGFERLDSDVTEASEQLEREAGMTQEPLDIIDCEEKDVFKTEQYEEEEEIEDVDLVKCGKSPEPFPVPTIDATPTTKTYPSTEISELAASIDTPVSTPTLKLVPEPSFLTPTTTGKFKRKIASPATIAVMERRRTRGLEKDEAILKVLTKPGTVTRREAERRRSLKAEFKGVV
ncbi:hypothetical protein H072_10182 [Dactylellina haptotyla CBS 200.50]|uniref:Deacetylase sirtuin-type domain-containing protein n=1 Tax=Dactylellina haptotyla (strain CBS 200.50) TaxID=1284197 RepID=S8BM03_DACHA|nr:hypothetical protein H072_10182 [Dactylellina haptotyla CBS 200.50]